MELKGLKINFLGDSITQGMAMGKGYTYPQHLQASIGSQYRVINAGVAEEATDAILSRANAIEFVFTFGKVCGSIGSCKHKSL